jgi:hypothetical protein
VQLQEIRHKEADSYPEFEQVVAGQGEWVEKLLKKGMPYMYVYNCLCPFHLMWMNRGQQRLCEQLFALHGRGAHMVEVLRLRL